MHKSLAGCDRVQPCSSTERPHRVLNTKQEKKIVTKFTTLVNNMPGVHAQK